MAAGSRRPPARSNGPTTTTTSPAGRLQSRPTCLFGRSAPPGQDTPAVACPARARAGQQSSCLGGRGHHHVYLPSADWRCPDRTPIAARPCPSDGLTNQGRHQAPHLSGELRLPALQVVAQGGGVQPPLPPVDLRTLACGRRPAVSEAIHIILTIRTCHSRRCKPYRLVRPDK